MRLQNWLHAGRVEIASVLLPVSSLGWMPETGKQAISVERERERLEGKMAIPLGTKQENHHLLASRAELVACWHPSSTTKSWAAPYHLGFLDSVGHFYTVRESFIPK